jgi:hypothetical protein
MRLANRHHRRTKVASDREEKGESIVEIIEFEENKQFSNPFGKFYWCVGLKREGKEHEEIYLWAARVGVDSSGGLTFCAPNGDVNLALAPGEWNYVYAASTLDGSAAAVEHWPSQIIESKRN